MWDREHGCVSGGNGKCNGSGVFGRINDVWDENHSWDYILRRRKDNDGQSILQQSIERPLTTNASLAIYSVLCKIHNDQRNFSSRLQLVSSHSQLLHLISLVVPSHEDPDVKDNSYSYPGHGETRCSYPRKKVGTWIDSSLVRIFHAIESARTMP